MFEPKFFLNYIFFISDSPLKKCVRSIEAKSPREKSPRKLELLVSEMIDGAKSPPKRKLNLSDESPKKKSVDSFEASPQKLMKFNNSERLCLTKPESNEMSANHDGNTVLRRSPRKLKSFNDANGEIVETSDSKRNLKSRILVEDNLWTDRENNGVVRRSPRKLNFDVNSKDVLAVVKNVFGPSKNFKSNEESCFPLHQKLLICALLLVIKKGKKKDANIGKVSLQILTKNRSLT